MKKYEYDKISITQNGLVIAELTDEKFIINEVQDAIDLIADLGTHNCNRIIIRKNNLHNDFFKLSTGLAGDILQKFSNYNVKLAITGDFSEHKSKSLDDFIRECNRGRLIFFLDDLTSALERLSKK